MTIVRSLTTLPILIPSSYAINGSLLGNREMIGFLVYRGFFAMMGVVFAYLAVQLLSLSEAMLLYDSYPALLAFLCWMMKMETVGVYGWFGILGALTSQVLITRPAFLFGQQGAKWTTARSIGILSSILSTVGLAVGYLLVNRKGKKVSVISLTIVGTVEILLVSIPFLVFEYPKAVSWDFSLKNCLLYTIVSIGQLHQIFNARSYQLGPPIKAAFISLTRVVIAVTTGVFLLGEEMTLMTGIGAGLMIVSIALVLWSRDHQLHLKQTDPDGNCLKSLNEDERDDAVFSTDCKKTRDT